MNLSKSTQLLSNRASISAQCYNRACSFYFNSLPFTSKKIGTIKKTHELNQSSSSIKQPRNIMSSTWLIAKRTVKTKSLG